MLLNSLLTLILIFVSNLALSETSLESRVMELNGKVSYHNGPNCFNAVSLVQGFTNLKTHTSGMSLRFHLENFCTQTNTPERGDVMTIRRQRTLEHASTVWSKELVFEKGSMSGLNGNFDDRVEGSIYRFLNPSNSPYVTNCQQNCKIEYYTCQFDYNKEKSLEACKKTTRFKEILDLKNELETISFTDNDSDENIVQQIAMRVDSITPQVESLSRNDPCAIFYLSEWDGIFGHVYNLAQEIEFKSLTDSPGTKIFGPSLRKLNSDLRAKFPDQKIQSILNEGWSAPE